MESLKQKQQASVSALRPRYCLCVAACSLLAVGGALSAERERPMTGPIPALQEQPLQQYRALRRMHAQNEKFNQEGWVDCWTELDAQGFRYEIVSERGSDYIREKVLKTLLRREQELIAGGSANRAELTDANYEFTETEESTASGERAILLKPRRKDVLLVDGRMIVNPEGTELLRVEGRLAKNPSFWTSLVDIVREFARVDGVRVPISTDTTAKLKFAGLSRMDVRYDYVSINGRAVSLEARQNLSSTFPR
jgi:hypothetical protein